MNKTVSVIKIVGPKPRKRHFPTRMPPRWSSLPIAISQMNWKPATSWSAACRAELQFLRENDAKKILSSKGSW